MICRQFRFIHFVAVSVSFLSFLRAAAPAEEEKKSLIAWRPSLVSALGEAGTSDRPVFLQLSSEACHYCQLLETTTFVDKDVVGLINASYVPVKLNPESDMSVIAKYGITSLPSMLIIRANNQVVEKIPGYGDGPAYSAILKRALKAIRSLPPIGAQAGLPKLLDDAETDFSAGRFAMCLPVYRRIAGEKGSYIGIEKAKARLAEIDKLAAERFEAAKASAAAKKYAEASAKLDEWLTNFSDLKPAAEAKVLRQHLTDDPEARKAIRTAAAQKLFDEAAKDMSKKRYRSAMVRFETVATQYPEIPIAKRAASELKDCRGNRRISQAAADEVAGPQCKIWMSLAKSWKSAQKTDLSKEYLTKVITTFPDSTFADEAKEMMQKL